MKSLFLSFCVWFTAIGLLVPAPAATQVTLQRTNRDDRIVIYSPHFDEPARNVGLGCHRRPVRMYGFEDTTRVVTVPVLSLRILQDEFDADEFSPRGLNLATVRLTAKLDGTRFVDLPTSGQVPATTDSAGFVTLTAPAGIYKLSILRIGYVSAEGIIQLRRTAHDSLRVVMAAHSLC